MGIYDALTNEQGGDDPYRESMCEIIRGIVISNYDEEQKGKIRVKLEQYDDAANETAWIPMLSHYAGNAYGTYFLPEEGDEVLIAYINGNPRDGVVLGSMWGEKNLMPEDAPTEKNTIKKLLTRGGHTLIFDDEEDKGGITVKTKKELTMTLLDEEEIITIQDKDGKNLLQIDAANSVINITSDSDINISAKSAINITGDDADIKIEGKDISISGKNVKIEAQTEFKASGQNVKLEGQDLSMKGDTGAKLESSAMLTLKGSMTKIN